MLRWNDRPLAAVLLDLDDTILDGRAGLDEAWDQAASLLAARLETVSASAVRAQIRVSSDWYWDDDERHRRGRLDMPGSRRAVLAHVLECLGRPDPRLAGEVAVAYGALRDARLAPFPGALDALARLRARTPALGLVTNGAAAAQRAKIERWGLAAFFDVIAIEGEVGAGKPDARHFGHALGALGVDPAATLMAGDNYACDVLGALHAGLEAVWIDREGRREPPAAPPRPHRTLASFVALVEALER
ncbi:HAD-IA family hydrolase [Myxococcota bacterium]|nr:HAD-IA family hydrolase [Myxococcota bacterium]MCZ7617699.1 HAD-IA family hydrolase [Myxococcota bacterium]